MAPLDPGEPFLRAKLTLPPTGGGIERPRLLAELDREPGAAVTLLAAPPGFGKTTLLVDWLRAQRRPVAWVSLDAGDNDPARFWGYVIAALDAVCSGLGDEALAVLRSHRSPSLERVLAILLNAIVERGEPLILALDDYHVVEALPIHASLRYLVEHLPPCLHLAIASRTDPPLPLTQLRARGRLHEVRELDLAFTLGEAVTFLEEVMSLRLPNATAQALARRTEGWIAGLQLAALSLRGQADPARRAAVFAGDHRYLLDYLLDEVLDRQPPEIRAFLLDTAVLDRLSAPLCEAVTERPDGQAILETIERAHLFLVPLDERREWYRYHHLFADALRAYLGRTQPERAPELHRRAACWLAQAGYVDEAIHHALAGGTCDLAADLIERAAPGAYERGEWTSLLAWQRALPAEVLRVRPRLGIYAAAGLLYTGQPGASARLDEAERVLENNAGGLGEEERRVLAGELVAMRSLHSFLRADLPSTRALCEQALASLLGDHPFRQQVLLGLGTAAWLDGDVDAASRALREARRTAERARNVYLMQVAIAYLAQVRLLAGHRREASALHRANLVVSVERGSNLDANGPLVGMGATLYEENDLAGALEHLADGLERGEREGNALIVVGGTLVLARARLTQGDVAGARALLTHAATVAERNSITWTWVTGSVRAWMVRLWLALGEVDEAADCAAEVEPCEERPRFLAEADALALARVHLARQQPAAALDVLAPLLSEAESAGRLGIVREILVLQAMAQHLLGERREAIRSFKRALEIAGPEGFVRSLLDEGEPIRSLLEVIAAAEGADQEAGLPVREYARVLLNASELPHSVAPPLSPSPLSKPPPGDLIEPLSERELEILRLVATGASNQEIADTAFIAVNTVKKHLKNVFAKLEASSRTQAVARARELRLL